MRTLRLFTVVIFHCFKQGGREHHFFFLIFWCSESSFKGKFTVSWWVPLDIAVAFLFTVGWQQNEMPYLCKGEEALLLPAFFEIDAGGKTENNSVWLNLSFSFLVLKVMNPVYSPSSSGVPYTNAKGIGYPGKQVQFCFIIELWIWTLVNFHVTKNAFSWQTQLKVS